MYLLKKLSLVIILFICFNNSNAQSLRIVYGNKLYFQHNSSFFLVRQLDDDSIFQGYDIIDSSKVIYIVLTNKKAEPSSQVFIFNIIDRNEIFVDEIGGTGESYFNYNIENGNVIFNWFDGIYRFELFTENHKIVNNINPLLIINCQECYLPFWVNSNRFGYQKFENEEFVTKFFDLN